MSNKQNIETFNTYFNKLDKYLERELDCIDKRKSFASKTKEFIEKNKRFKFLESNLSYIREVRNLMVHEKIEIDDYPIIPSKDTCNKLIELYSTISKPPRWDSIAVSKNEIYKCTEKDTVSEVINEMSKNTFTHVPVVKGNVFQWLLSESVYMHWLNDLVKNGKDFDKDICISDLKKYSEKVNDTYLFLPNKTDVFAIEEEFENKTREVSRNSFKRLGVIFITKDGKKTQEILGLITAWDLGKINK
jgi:CBS domain-containing protein